MRLRTKILLGTASVAIAGVTFLSIDTGRGCPSIEEKNASKHYTKALLHGGGESNNKMRFDGAYELYRQGEFDEIIFAGTADDQRIFVELNRELGMPYKLAKVSRDTTDEEKNASELIKPGEPVLRISGEEQMDRIAYIVRKHKLDPEKNDGYVGVRDTYTGFKANLRERIACEGVRYGKESWLRWIENHIPFYKSGVSQ